MVQVASVNMPVVKEVEPQIEEMLFAPKHDNVESNDKGMRTSTALMIGLGALSVIILAALAVKRGRIKNAPLKDMPATNANPVLGDNPLTNGLFKIKGGKVYKEGELYTGNLKTVKNNQSFDMKFQNGILQELKTFKAGDGIEPSTSISRKYKWFANGKTAQIDITKQYGGSVSRERVTRPKPDSNVLEYRSKFKYGTEANNALIVDHMGLVNVSESCQLKRISADGKVEHLTEYKGVNYDDFVTFTCDENGRLVGNPIFEEITHSSETYFG